MYIVMMIRDQNITTPPMSLYIYAYCNKVFSLIDNELCVHIIITILLLYTYVLFYYARMLTYI